MVTGDVKITPDSPNSLQTRETLFHPNSSWEFKNRTHLWLYYLCSLFQLIHNWLMLSPSMSSVQFWSHWLHVAIKLIKIKLNVAVPQSKLPYFKQGGHMRLEVPVLNISDIENSCPFRKFFWVRLLQGLLSHEFWDLIMLKHTFFLHLFQDKFQREREKEKGREKIW